MVDRYEWPAISMSPLSSSERKRAVKKLWHYPKRCFDLYNSAELHTVKRRVPKKFFVLLAVPLVILAIVVAVPKIMGHTHPKAATAAVVSTPGRSAAASEPDHQHWDSVSSYVKDFIPRIANAPWSAPVYDGRPVKANPDLLCIEYDRVISGTTQHLCSCYTEQVTPYRIGNVEECRRYARDGVYNPYRDPVQSRERDSRRDAHVPSSASPVSASAPVAQSGQGWQPEWRTRAYVQPERTATGGPHVQSSWGG
jgi:hypothetical protein